MNILRQSFARLAPDTNYLTVTVATTTRLQSTNAASSAFSSYEVPDFPVNPRKVFPLRRRAKARSSKSFARNVKGLNLEDAIKNLKDVESTRPRTLELFLSSALPSGLNKNAFRGSLSLPHGFSKLTQTDEIVVVFSNKEQVDAVKAAGIEHVGPTADLFPKILDGTIKPLKVFATPEELSHITRNIDLVKFLGKKGLVPSTRRGTVVKPSGIKSALAESQKLFHWKGDERGCVRLPSGRLDQSTDELIANVQAICGSIGSLIANHNGTSKNIRKVCLSATHLPSYVVVQQDVWKS